MFKILNAKKPQMNSGGSTGTQLISCRQISLFKQENVYSFQFSGAFESKVALGLLEVCNELFEGYSND